MVSATNTHRPATQRYGLAVAVALASAVLQQTLHPVLGEALPFQVLYPAVMVSAWFGGWGPGLLTTFLTGLAGIHFAQAPFFHLGVERPVGLARGLAFVVTGSVISLLCEALHGARRREEAARLRMERLAEQRVGLDAVAVSLAQAMHVSEVGEVILERGRRMLGARAGRLAVIDPLDRTLRVLHAVGYPAAFEESTTPIPLDAREPMSDAVRERRPVVIDSRQASDDAYPHLAALRDRTGTQAIAVLPLLVRGRVLGGLGFSFAQARRFDGDDLALLQTLAYQCGAAVERAELYEAERLSRVEAQRLNRLKDDFLATLSHELRTPLSAILVWLDLLRTEELGRGALRAADMIQRSAGSLSQLIEELLDVSRIVTGKLNLNRRAVDLRALLNGLVESARPAAEGKALRLVSRVEPGLGEIWADGGRLRQALENLLSNAVKFTAEGGSIELRAARVGTRVKVEVQDTGVGIAPELLPLVFERFRQGDSGSTRAQQGLGLGLTIAQHIAELHGGRILAASPGAGQGSLFTLDLPASSPPPARGHLAAGPPRDRPSARPLQHVRVLLVDDHEDTLQGVALALEAAGASVTTASSAREALAELELRPPDVLVSDIAMPEVDGHDLLRAVRRLPEESGGETPAIALSAYVSPEDRLQAVAAGYQEQVPKPVEMRDLVAAIARLAAAPTAAARTEARSVGPP
jgi:signal transduction histidine kinase/ActR/RegA family two-component response regulator